MGYYEYSWSFPACSERALKAHIRQHYLKVFVEWIATHLTTSIADHNLSWLEGTSLGQWISQNHGAVNSLRKEDVDALPLHLYVTQNVNVEIIDTNLLVTINNWPDLELGETGTFLSLSELDIRPDPMFQTVEEAFEELFCELQVAKAVRVRKVGGDEQGDKARWFWLVGGVFNG